MPVAALHPLGRFVGPPAEKCLGTLVIWRIAAHTGSAENGVPTVRYHSCDLAPSKHPVGVRLVRCKNTGTVHIAPVMILGPYQSSRAAPETVQ
jgi:hypothetical protein